MAKVAPQRLRSVRHVGPGAAALLGGTTCPLAPPDLVALRAALAPP